MGDEISVYRIGGPHRYPHWKWPFHVDRWLRSWQAEWEQNCLWAPRSWTPSMVRRKALRWQRRNTDLRKHEHRYGPNLLVRKRRGLTP